MDPGDNLQSQDHRRPGANLAIHTQHGTEGCPSTFQPPLLFFRLHLSCRGACWSPNALNHSEAPWIVPGRITPPRTHLWKPGECLQASETPASYLPPRGRSPRLPPSPCTSLPSAASRSSFQEPCARPCVSETHARHPLLASRDGSSQGREGQVGSVHGGPIVLPATEEPWVRTVRDRPYCVGVLPECSRKEGPELQSLVLRGDGVSGKPPALGLALHPAGYAVGALEAPVSAWGGGGDRQELLSEMTLSCRAQLIHPEHAGPHPASSRCGDAALSSLLSAHWCFICVRASLTCKE